MIVSNILWLIQYPVYQSALTIAMMWTLSALKCLEHHSYLFGGFAEAWTDCKCYRGRTHRLYIQILQSYHLETAEGSWEINWANQGRSPDQIWSDHSDLDCNNYWPIWMQKKSTLFGCPQVLDVLACVPGHSKLLHYHQSNDGLH